MPVSINPPIVLKPTFPLDEAEIKRRSLWEKARHPLSWGVLAGCVMAAVFGGVPGFLGLLALGSFGLHRFWRGRANSMKAHIIQEMISESNREQDRKLSRIVKSYRDQGMHPYAVALGKFLRLKQHIEKRLHAGMVNGRVPGNVQEVEKLVDRVCGAVCREFHEAALLDGELAGVLTSRDTSKLERLQAKRSEVLEAIMHAYGTLYESLAAVLDLETAHEAVAPDLEEVARRQLDEPNLADVVEKLREENRLARRVRDRLGISAAERGDPDFGVFAEEAVSESES